MRKIVDNKVEHDLVLNTKCQRTGRSAIWMRRKILKQQRGRFKMIKWDYDVFFKV